MRELLLGLLLGALLTMFPTWTERNKMGINTDIGFYVIIGLLVFVFLWKYILKFISKKYPKFYIWINEFNAPTPITEEYRKKAYEKKPKKDNKGVK